MPEPARILAVDDDLVVLHILRGMVASMGHLCLEASSGEEALRICEDTPLDLILLDMNLPGIQGLNVLQKLHAHPACRDLPIIMVSGVTDASDKVAAFEAGATDYLTKPFDVLELRARVTHHLEFHHQRATLARSQADLRAALDESDQLNRVLFEMNERLRQSEQRKGHFISNIRSEFNNPLTGIIALAGQLARGQVPLDRHQEVSQSLFEEALDLDFQLRNIVCAAELEAGELAPEPTHVPVATVLQEVESRFAHLIRAKGLQVHARVEGEPLPLDKGLDASKMALIVSNLLANALAWSPEGGTVEILAHSDAEGLLVQVSDQGPGIHPRDQRAIFERFHQLESGSTRSHRGHGLGLSVVEALAHLLQGWVRVDSAPGRGATFQVYFPALVLPPEADHETSDGSIFLFDDFEER